jgi:HAD superfamily hydrolase (TIGR01662 family)
MESGSAKIELVIFDVDGTLAEAYALDLLPGVRDFFQLVFHSGCEYVPKVAVATNQGGVGMRYMLERRGLGSHEKYPTVGEIEKRLREILASLGAAPHLPIYVSYTYQTRQGKWTPVPPEEAENPRWMRQWRKPQPGMILQAMKDAGVSRRQTLFVGDSPDDQGAAHAAGCRFAWAGDFFARFWKTCDQLDRLA